MRLQISAPGKTQEESVECRDTVPDGVKYIASLDIGTTTIKCFIYAANRDIAKLDVVGTAHEQIVPGQLWDSVLRTIRNAMMDAALNVERIECLSISTQRNTFTCWNRITGKVYHNFITWKDLRADKLVHQWNNSFKLRMLKLGARFLHFFSRSKRFLAGSVIKMMNPQVTLRLAWVLQNNADLQRDVKNGNVLYGTIDSWLLYRLRQGTDQSRIVEHVSDVTNCTSSGFYDPFGQEWAGWALNLFSIKKELLPKVVDNSYDFGYVDESLFGSPIRIGASISDQSASMWGNCCFEKGDVKITLGTGSFLNVNTGSTCLASVHGLYPLVGHKLTFPHGTELIYLMEGASNDNGSIIEWAMNIGLFVDPSETSAMALSVTDSDGVSFIPAFSGLGPPIRDDTAGTGFIGIKPSTRKEHLVRAILESLAYRIALLYSSALDETRFTFNRIKVDGGVSRNDFICQTLADLTGLPVERGEVTDSTALGAMFLAGLNVGIWRSKQELIDIRKIERIFQPNGANKRHCMVSMQSWERAVERFKRWYITEKLNNLN
ncbi:putative glycerol kinase 5 isoform X2 [Malaya genurostris]|uniref:putative glycerol kinase 5 isoform X2 n=1 Tax=Malaya genurostris TaxID=325434 RepID=UPI0026F3F089|nr:putative glycerol kinase 5 isoform X2 [Malaya genurostris]